MSTEWTDELKQEVVDAYVEMNPTPVNSMDLVKELAEEYEKTPNGIRMILTKAEVYVKKEAAVATKKEGTTRVSKASAIADLSNAILELGGSVEEDILSKMTGKAAMYFTGILKAAK